MSNAAYENWNRLKFDLGEKILSLLDDDNVTEIMVNPDGSLWIEEHGKEIEEIGSISPEKTKMIINTIASSLGKVVDLKNPTIGGELPYDGSRFQGVIPPNAIAPMFSIRKKAIKILTLEDYLNSGIITKNQKTILSDICRNRKNILISGATGSGKTTFANALLKEVSIIDPKCRMAIIEDTRELQCDLKNKFALRTSEYRSMQDLLLDVLRLNVKRICIGEVRGAEAFTLLTAWNTGHGGGFATVHANNAKAGIQRIEQILMAYNFKPVPQIIAEAINVIVSIQKSIEGRKVEEIVKVSYMNNDYVFEEIK